KENTEPQALAGGLGTTPRETMCVSQISGEPAHVSGGFSLGRLRFGLARFQACLHCQAGGLEWTSGTGGEMRTQGWRWWLAVVAVSLVLRLSAMIALQAHHRGTETAHHEHRSIAANLVAGKGFRFNFFGHLDNPVPTSQQAPLVPGVLAGAYLLFGVETPTAFAAVLGLQILISSITVLLLSLLAH